MAPLCGENIKYIMEKNNKYNGVNKYNGEKWLIKRMIQYKLKEMEGIFFQGNGQEHFPKKS